MQSQPYFSQPQLPTVLHTPPTSSPEGMHRSYAQNYKDLVLANCIANAYAYDVKVGIDAGSSVSAMEDWANYDWEVGPNEIRALVKKYLARDYTTRWLSHRSRA